MKLSEGEPEIRIGLIDGPVGAHPDLVGARSQTLLGGASINCQNINSLACQHGTFITGILCSRRGSQAPGICPNCTILVRPIFCEEMYGNPPCPEVTTEELARTICETVDAGVNTINLSLGLANTALIDYPDLEAAIAYAMGKGVLLVAAAGNQGNLGPLPLFKHPWTIPVIACDARGQIAHGSNLGLSVGRSGLIAPGVNVTSTAPETGFTSMSGTSVAAPFVTGEIALLQSLFPRQSAAQIRRAILRPGVRRGSVCPPLLDAWESWQFLSDQTG
ncbi:S8 family serine peptidase [Leptothoe spongobia TAU-MAC 1115]|uniref:S8 family serine peptidase n=2 Tax=Leptothoe TaxID=2651725 RepID=A0A947GIZ4_9CYAN|nr:S8 family serine peptidase [Leptothoe spongobia TAU-MAC 1115]